MNDPVALSILVGAFSICTALCYCFIGVFQLGMSDKFENDSKFRKEVSNLTVITLLFMGLAVICAVLLVF